MLSITVILKIYHQVFQTGLPKKIEGNYRVIEHDVKKQMWYAYDLKKLEVDSKGIILKVPVIMYESMFGSKWKKKIETEESFHNFYVDELVYIIKKEDENNTEPKKELKKPKLNISTALNRVKIHDTRHVFIFKTKLYIKDKEGNDGDLICAKSIHNMPFIGIWYSTNGEVYNVNGSAKTLSPDFKLTFKISIDKGLQICKSLF